jgi:hypothetical protein
LINPILLGDNTPSKAKLTIPKQEIRQILPHRFKAHDNKTPKPFYSNEEILQWYYNIKHTQTLINQRVSGELHYIASGV